MMGRGRICGPSGSTRFALRSIVSSDDVCDLEFWQIHVAPITAAGTTTSWASVPIRLVGVASSSYVSTLDTQLVARSQLVEHIGQLSSVEMRAVDGQAMVLGQGGRGHGRLSSGMEGRLPLAHALRIMSRRRRSSSWVSGLGVLLGHAKRSPHRGLVNCDLLARKQAHLRGEHVAVAAGHRGKQVHHLGHDVQVGGQGGDGPCRGTPCS